MVARCAAKRKPCRDSGPSQYTTQRAIVNDLKVDPIPGTNGLKTWPTNQQSSLASKGCKQSKCIGANNHGIVQGEIGWWKILEEPKRHEKAKANICKHQNSKRGIEWVWVKRGMPGTRDLTRKCEESRSQARPGSPGAQTSCTAGAKVHEGVPPRWA